MIITKAELEAIAVKAAQYPEDSMAEIAFAGRSNVGKSSLLNLLTGRKSLARVSCLATDMPRFPERLPRTGDR